MTVSWRLLLPFRRQSPQNYITVKLRIWKSFEEWFIVLCSQLDRRVRVWRPLKVIPVLAWLTEKWAKRAINEIIERCTTKEDIQMANEHLKDAQHHSLSEKCKSKPQWGTISRQSEWLWSKSLQAINAGEGVEKRGPSYTVGGNAN